MPLPVAAAAPVVAAGAQALGAIADPIISLINTKRNNETQAEIAQASNQMQYDVAAANIRAQRDENALDRAYNSEEAEKAYQRSVELQAQQAYLNSPEVMLRHYHAAGLNPNLMIKGSGSVASGGSAPAASFSGSVTPQSISPVLPNIEKMPNFVGGLLDAVGKIASIKQVLSDAELKGANTDQIRQTVDLMVRNLQADAVGKEILNKYQPYLLDKDVALKVANISYLEKEASLADLQGETEKAERLLKERQAAVAVVEKELKGEQRDNWKLINSHFEEDFQNRQDNLKANTRAAKASASVNEQQFRELFRDQNWLDKFNQTVDGVNPYAEYIKSRLEQGVHENLLKKAEADKINGLLPSLIKEAEAAAAKGTPWTATYFVDRLLQTAGQTAGTAALLLLR